MMLQRSHADRKSMNVVRCLLQYPVQSPFLSVLLNCIEAITRTMPGGFVDVRT